MCVPYFRRFQTFSKCPSGESNMKMSATLGSLKLTFFFFLILILLLQFWEEKADFSIILVFNLVGLQTTTKWDWGFASSIILLLMKFLCKFFKLGDPKIHSSKVTICSWSSFVLLLLFFCWRCKLFNCLMFFFFFVVHMQLFFTILAKLPTFIVFFSSSSLVVVVAFGFRQHNKVVPINFFSKL